MSEQLLKFNNRTLLHPFNILQYYQNENQNIDINVPDALIT